MTVLYRVFPWLPDVKPGQPGHALFIGGQGAGRVDNPDRYRVLYASDSGAGSCAEVFDYKAIWSAGMLRGSPSLPGSVRALATIVVDRSVTLCDLDDAARLKSLGLRPSQVVTRDREVTRSWALRIFQEGSWGGVRWWSYHDSRWGSHGIWALDSVRLESVEALTLDHPDLQQASEILNRPIQV